MSKIRLQKFLSDAGISSRRKSEEFIKSGLVKVNGKVVKEMGFKVEPGKNIVKFKDKRVEAKPEFIYIALNKPVGYVCTSRKFKGERNILDLVKIEKRLYPTGRLDKNSSGLLILTNDGDFAFKLTHPRYQKEKEYKVIIKNQNLNPDMIIEKFKNGIDIGEGDGIVKAKKAEYLGDGKFRIILTQGKKRQIRRMFEKLGYQILKLKRIRIASLKLGNLKTGEWRYLKEDEIRSLIK